MFDLAPFENLPPLSREDAAALAGITPEVLDRILENSGTVGEGGEGKPLSILHLLRAGFALLGRKEAQAAMLGLQLGRALEREKSLVTTLQSRILDEPLTMPTLVSENCLDEEEPRRKKKKKKKER
ncbi:MAG: hypothetical protein HQL64_12085 [Magnetococcales bacterium]|nr:hypothetical protein [Magnetococcales bacterium]